MKRVISLAIVALMGLPAFASFDQVLADSSLATLLKANPEAVYGASPEQKTLVSALLAISMASQFDAKGEGNLAVISNECEYVGRSRIVECTLTVNDTDMKINEEGNYVRTEASTESSLMIKYKVVGDQVVGTVKYWIAG